MDRPAHWIAALGACGLAIAAGTALIAQVSGDRGIAPVASSTDISIGGIEVDATGKNADDARRNGWLQAERKAWEKLGGPKMSDSDIDSMVSAIVIESEQIGPRRYIAKLGVVFDRTKAGSLLSGQGGPQVRSAPMLTIPVLRSGGTYTVYEVRNPWQRAWAEYQAGRSAIDYVRPSGAGGDSLLVNYGQISRRSRSWWRNVLDAFGAADVIVPVAQLERQWPGGPVKGTFTARYGPDDKFLQTFTLTAKNEDEVPAMLNKAIVRFDQIYTAALNAGQLRPDPSLRTDRLTLDPTVAALIAAERDAQSAEAAAAAAAAAAAVGETLPGEVAPTPVPAAQTVNSFVVQFTTPNAAAVDSGLASVRGTPGVRGAATSSMAIGGISVMRVSYGGDLAALAAALRARGWNVSQGGNSLSISR
ncbi:heavy-metal-associated domain-containing protein [Altererythrobacter fulvus]|uniref:heavy-metal-associated domain-containing protein n=1 Tax=Caenibius fulvus TaxID=2126012 RepID=UPI0030164AA4